METEFALSLGTQRWTLPAESDTITIGRASNADVRLQADDQISRIHARLGRTGTTWTLHDESRNGTGLNGRRLAAPTPLTEGDRIHIGRSVLTFHETPVQAPAEPAPSPAASAPARPAPAPAALRPPPLRPPPPLPPHHPRTSALQARHTAPSRRPGRTRPGPRGPSPLHPRGPHLTTPNPTRGRQPPEPRLRSASPRARAGRFTPADHASDASPFTPRTGSTPALRPRGSRVGVGSVCG